MRLALALGRTRRELLASVGADELTLWYAFLAEYDLPDGYFVAGRVAPAAANAWGAESKPADFVPFYSEPDRVMTPAEIRAKFARAREVAASAHR